MYRVVSSIVIQQMPNTAWPNRKTLIGLDFFTEYEWTDSWRDLTNNGKLIIPKNLYFRDQYNKQRPLHGTNVNIGGFDSTAPLLLRGDKVIMSVGWKYFAHQNDNRETTNISVILSGYIAEVSSKIPIEMKIEDNMWILKQTPVETKTFHKADGLNTILKYIVDRANSQHGTNFTFNALTQTTFGEFPIGNETACQVLQRMQKTYGFESYFRGNELRSGALVYIPEEAVTHSFTFQEDIIEEDNLKYVRKDDLTLSAVARNTIEEETGKLTKDGHAKTKRVRLEVLVSIRDNKRTTRVITKNVVVPHNEEGERRTLFFPGARTVQQLADLAFAKLTQYYYDGLRGKFVVFGLPFVKQGDNVKLVNPILPEQNGTYKVKAVRYFGGFDQGIRQEIEIDFKINI